MKTQQQYFDEINNNWTKFNASKDCYVKKRLRKLSTANLKYCLTFINDTINFDDTNSRRRPSDKASYYAAWQPIIRYIEFTISKREKQEGK